MNCDEALMMKMAELDGERTRSADVDSHVDSCENCCRDLALMRNLDELFQKHERVESNSTVWPAVNERISKQASRVGWHIFAVAALALVAFKIIGMSLANEPGFLFGLVPLAIAGVLFALLRENPFKVNTELVLEK
jgi:predicted anti-sigma-YlaC factor YlaD